MHCFSGEKDHQSTAPYTGQQVSHAAASGRARGPMAPKTAERAMGLQSAPRGREAEEGTIGEVNLLLAAQQVDSSFRHASPNPLLVLPLQFLR